MLLRNFRKKVVLAGFAAEAQAPKMVADKAELSPTVGTAILKLGHGLHLGFEVAARRLSGAVDCDGVIRHIMKDA
jgi:hypothetical protein